MACTALHILIAEKYCEKHKVENPLIYLDGAILPDIQKDKVASHFGKDIKPMSVKEALDAKVDIKTCAKTLDFEKDVDKALFLHLLTDYVYYNFLYQGIIDGTPLKVILSDIENDSGVMTKQIQNTHAYTLPNEISYLLNEKENCGEYRLFNGDKFDAFVNLISSFDLKQVKKEILKNPSNFLELCLKTLEKNEPNDSLE